MTGSVSFVLGWFILRKYPSMQEIHPLIEPPQDHERNSLEDLFISSGCVENLYLSSSRIKIASNVECNVL